MGCRKTQCAACCSVTVVVLLVGALATPWWFDNVSVDGPDGSCNTFVLVGWQEEYCSSNGNDCQCPQSSMNWRNNCEADCGKTETLMDVAGSLVGLSLGAYVIVAGGLLLRCLGKDKSRRRWHFILSLVGYALLIASVVYFATRAADVMDTNGFYGSKSTNVGPYSQTENWGGFGWGIAAVTVIFAGFTVYYSNQNDIAVPGYEGAYQPVPGYPGQQYPYPAQQYPVGAHAGYGQPPAAYSQPAQGHYTVQSAAPGYAPPSAYVPIGRTEGTR